MSWKNFLFFSKGEKNGILVLICLIIVVIAANRILPCYFRSKPMEMSVYQSEIERFKSELKPLNGQATHFVNAEKIELFPFDPNRSDSLDFIRLGVPPYLIVRILKYRIKGGIFRKPEDFSKIYGMNEDLYIRLSPYISIENQPKKIYFSSKEKNKTIVKENPFPEKREKQPAFPIETIELNSADTATLKKLKGIGTVYADRIIKYRNYLGGFYRKEQLREVYGISEVLYQSIIPHVTIDRSIIKKIRLNGNDLKKQLRHPYLKKEQLAALILFRQKNGTIRTFETLKEISEFSDEDCERLIPYLSFD